MDCLTQQYYTHNSMCRMPQDTMHFKIQVARRIIYNPEFMSSNFFDLIDNEKLISIDVNEMNDILDSGCFSISEKDYIRELRRKTMNRKTAKQSRIRDKHEYQELNGEIDALLDIKKKLLQEKEKLAQEINLYKKLVSNQ
eukprot:TRINITY_DN345_c0_g2_i1.p1 TRINITY_DN345_c0_g2~~TRINITY_DN345_c0_g2_i1.p1  ORF type:complete len:140 (+),score=18.61 TRINITY_DN345_c0_g2_i1:565-984(+)